MKRTFNVLKLVLILTVLPACGSEVTSEIKKDPGPIFNSNKEVKDYFKRCEGQVEWKFAPAGITVQGVRNHATQITEWKYGYNGENITGIYNFKSGKVEWMTANPYEKYVGVYNYSNHKVEWQLSTSDIKYFGEYNAATKKVEWKSSSEGDFVSVYNEKQGLVEWQFTKIGDGPMTGIYNSNLGLVDWQQAEPGYRYFGIYDESTAQVQWWVLDEPRHLWLQYNYTTNEVEQKHYYTTSGTYAGVYGCTSAFLN